MHVLTLVANSTLLLYKKKLSYCFAVWHCWNGVNKTKGIEQSTVQRHDKEVGLERKEEGGGSGVGGLWLEWKVTLSCPNFIFSRMHETLWWSIVVKYRFHKDNFCRCLRSVFILWCYLIIFDAFEWQLSVSNINRTSTFNFPSEK